MHTALYVIWFLIPVLFFGIALYGKLEQWSGRDHHENFGDYVRQGLFILGCVFICIAIDTYLLQDFIDATFGEWLPLGVAQVLLLPLILLIAAKILGGTTPIRIEGKGRQHLRKKKR